MEKKISYLILFMIIGTTLLWGLSNYSCVSTSDPLSYLRYGVFFSHFKYYDFPPTEIIQDKIRERESVKGFFSTDVVKKDKTVPLVAISFPIMLGVAIKVGGVYAPFFINIFLLSALIYIYFHFLKRLFSGVSQPHILSVIGVLLFLIMMRKNLNIAILPYRDLPAFFFLVTALFCVDKFILSKRWISLIIGGIALGFSVSIREPMVLVLFPLFGYLTILKLQNKTEIPYFRTIFMFGVFFTVGISPLLIQNYIAQGNIFVSSQAIYATSNLKSVVPPGSRVHALSPINIRYTFFPALRYFWQCYYGPLFCVPFFLGIFYLRSKKAVNFLLLTSIVIYIMFYSMWPRAVSRYLMTAHIFTVPYIAYGLYEIIARINRKRIAISLGVLVVMLFALFLVNIIPYQSRNFFQIRQASQFKKDIGDVGDGKNIVFVERLMRGIIDYHTPLYPIKLCDLFRFGITPGQGIRYFMEKGYTLNFFDSVDRGRRHKFDHTPIARQQILDGFNLVAYKQLRGAKYNLEKYFGKEYCTLFKITEWEDNVIEQEIMVEQAEESILIINARKLWNNGFERTEAKLFLNGELLGDSITDGLNYFYVSGEKFEQGRCIVKLTSDAPVPGDLEPKLVNVYDDILLNCDKASVPLDSLYLSDDFMEDRPGLKKRRRAITTEGTVLIPTFPLPDSSLLLVCRAQLISKSDDTLCEIEFSLNKNLQARQIISRPNENNTFCIPLKSADIGGNLSRLVLDVKIKDSGGGAKVADEAFLEIAEFIIVRYDHGLAKIVINFGRKDGLFVQSGFYNKEKHLGKHPVRWVGPNAKINLPFTDETGINKLTITAWGRPRAAGTAVSEVFINDTKIGVLEVKPESRQRFTFDVPGSILLSGIDQMTFVTDTWRPCDIFESSDERQLGIMLESITLDFGKEKNNP